MSFWKRTMDYLGLGPDDAYDDYDEPPEPEPAARGSRSRDSRGGQPWPADPDDPTVRAVPARPSYPSRDFESPTRRAAPVPDDSGSSARPLRSSSPRVTTAPVGEPATVRPRRFDQAQELADKFKDGQAVILNLESTERDVARRLIDFASGVCYSLDGSMEKVATGVYLLKPSPQRIHRFDDYEG
jgi:cell division inhibitor SepF